MAPNPSNTTLPVKSKPLNLVFSGDGQYAMVAGDKIRPSSIKPQTKLQQLKTNNGTKEITTNERKTKRVLYDYYRSRSEREAIY